MSESSAPLQVDPKAWKKGVFIGDSTFINTHSDRPTPRPDGVHTPDMKEISTIQLLKIVDVSITLLYELHSYSDVINQD